MKKASFAGGVWMPSSTSGGTDTEVYFSLEKDTPFHLKRFDTEEEPKSILKVLQENGHPNFAQVSHVFQVEDGQYYYLAFKKHGVSLEDFLKSDVNKKRLSNKHLISSFYQKILVDLLRVWRHLVGLQVKCGLKLKNVYIYDGGDAPHVSLVDFSTGAAFCNQWDELVSLVEAINTNCSYAHGNGEMKSFLRIIKDGYKGGMENLSKNSLFWSLKQRKSLTCDLWDMVKNVPNMRLYKGEQIFSPDPSNWRQIFYRDFRLKALVEHFDVLNKRNNVEFLSYPYDKETRSCWQVICKTFAHFESTNKQVSHNIRTNKQTKDLLQRGQRAFNSEKEFQLLVESSFPEYIPALRTIACTFESISGLNIVPKNDILNNLFTKRN